MAIANGRYYGDSTTHESTTSRPYSGKSHDDHADYVHLSICKLPSWTSSVLDMEQPFIYGTTVVYNQTNDPKVVQAAKTLFKNPCTFVAGVPDMKFMRQFPFPEVAFWGRSNVGKSSLLNALIGTTIARTSNTPGRTQQLNFFNLGDRLMLVDMPGYGFANVPLKLKYQWEDLISAYLNERDQLKRVFLLIDARHGFKKNDIEIMTYLDELGCIFQILVTKSDKIPLASHANLKATMEEELLKHSAARPEVILTSAERKMGIHELQQLIVAL